MPAQYVIHHKTAKPRFRPIGKLGIVEWREDCSGCHNCVKRDCVYRLYRDEADTLRNEVGYLDYIYQCKGCLNCIQNCTKNILTRVVNPEFRRLGDGYYTPDLILSTWYQAETGKIPVSGAGYGGPFSGPGFDSMWTDMSEIVRPTRDGIHGREYISTSVDIGRKPAFLSMEGSRMVSTLPPLVSIPMPLIIDLSSPLHTLPPLDHIIAKTATCTDLIAIMDSRYRPENEANLHNIAFYLGPDSRPVPKEILQKTRLVEIADSKTVCEQIKELKKQHPEIVVAVRVDLNASGISRAIDLADLEEIEVIHVVADPNGNEI